MIDQPTKYTFTWQAVLALAFMALSGISCAGKREYGWHLVNTTAAPLSVALVRNQGRKKKSAAARYHK